MVATVETRERRSPLDAPRPPEGRRTRSLPAVWERLLAGGVAALLLGFSLSTYSPFWAPKAAVLLVVVVPGLVALWRVMRTRVPGAHFAMSFVLCAGVSALLADRPVLSFLGSHGWGTGWLFIAACAGLWALGGALSEPGARIVEKALIAGSLGTIAFAWLQALVVIPVDVLVAPGGRASGLLGNPVYLGAVAVGILALAGAKLRDSGGVWPWLAAGVAASGALQLAGSRAALLPGLVLVAVGAWRLGFRRGCQLLTSVVVGIGLAAGITALVPSSGTAGSESATSRAAVSLDPGPSGRIALWKAGAEATAARPLFGWGPGRTQTGVSPRIGPEVARAAADGSEYTDAHNLFVEYGVTTGLVGLAALIGWMITAGRRARGPLALFALAGALVGLAQPLSVSVTPVLALALGMAGRAPRTHSPHVPASVEGVPTSADVPSSDLPSSLRASSARAFGHRRGIALAAAGAGVGVIAAGAFLWGQVALADAALDFDERSLASADRLLPAWPVVDSVGWRIAAFDAIDNGRPSDWDRALARAEDAADADPAVSAAWVDLGDLHARLGHHELAERSYVEALARYPWSLPALHGAIHYASDAGDSEVVARLCEQRAEFATGDCLASVERVYGEGTASHLLP